MYCTIETKIKALHLVYAFHLYKCIAIAYMLQTKDWQ